ncbi:hypothetical protein PCCS19_15580 [Paenibacillus sp. CCS19]|nr:hypothetical protein [Paenibacillus cellulosilyticus]GMK38504.1 hypothetical protein PCCS19_15580 [Paenibacillus cellulosilyticus]
MEKEQSIQQQSEAITSLEDGLNFIAAMIDHYYYYQITDEEIDNICGG